MALDLKHQTVAQFLGRVRVQYQAADGEQACRLATWLVDAIDAGDVTDAQARAAWGMTTAQWASLKGRMTQARQSWRAVQAARGE